MTTTSSQQRTARIYELLSDLGITVKELVAITSYGRESVRASLYALTRDGAAEMQRHTGGAGLPGVYRRSARVLPADFELEYREVQDAELRDRSISDEWLKLLRKHHADREVTEWPTPCTERPVTVQRYYAEKPLGSGWQI